MFDELCYAFLINFIFLVYYINLVVILIKSKYNIFIFDIKTFNLIKNSNSIDI